MLRLIRIACLWFLIAGAGVAALDPHIPCDSWRLAVETNNLRDWLIPLNCLQYVAAYMVSNKYLDDSLAVAEAAVEYASSVELNGDGKDIWVFDIDETALSNFPYLQSHSFHTGHNLKGMWTSPFGESALPETLWMYWTLKAMKIRTVFLSARPEFLRKITEYSLQKAGYSDWEKLILKGQNDNSTTALVYKSGERKKLVAAGYRIIGNIGDQWSDILGDPQGGRTFKLPNPMYYTP